MIEVTHNSIEVLSAYSKHLKSLSPEDKYTRFCHHARDDQIDNLILQILYNQADHHLFTATENGNAIGFGHLARAGNDWELAVSVDSGAQGKGIANKLMSFMITWAQTHGVNNVFMHCILHNQKIQHLARKHGLRVIDRSGGEIAGKVELPRPTTFDYTAEFLREQRDLLSQITALQRKMWQNLNPISYATEHNISN